MGAKPRISRRKSDHLAVAASGQADFRQRTTLLEQVTLIHQAIPELALDDIDTSCTIAGHTLAAPIVISGMTGGTAEASAINRDLAIAAQERGIGFGVGSQRAMAEYPNLRSTFQVRDVAPNVFLIGNIGVVQARKLGANQVGELASSIGADAMAVHLNPAMELIQSDGDRDFRGALDTIAELVQSLPVPVIAKETGCGLSPETALALAHCGVATVDVSGAGGTSWVAVEARRAKPGSDAQALGEELWDWGLPTAVSVVACASAGLEVIATGGLRSGLDIARALALGAHAGGIAAPMLRAHQRGGLNEVRDLLARFEQVVRVATLLTGQRRSAELATTRYHLGLNLRAWLDDLELR